MGEAADSQMDERMEALGGRFYREGPTAEVVAAWEALRRAATPDADPTQRLRLIGLGARIATARGDFEQAAQILWDALQDPRLSDADPWVCLAATRDVAAALLRAGRETEALGVLRGYLADDKEDEVPGADNFTARSVLHEYCRERAADEAASAALTDFVEELVKRSRPAKRRRLPATATCGELAELLDWSSRRRGWKPNPLYDRWEALLEKLDAPGGMPPEARAEWEAAFQQTFEGDKLPNADVSDASLWLTLGAQIAEREGDGHRAVALLRLFFTHPQAQDRSSGDAFVVSDYFADLLLRLGEEAEALAEFRYRLEAREHGASSVAARLLRRHCEDQPEGEQASAVLTDFVEELVRHRRPAKRRRLPATATYGRLVEILEWAFPPPAWRRERREEA